MCYWGATGSTSPQEDHLLAIVQKFGFFFMEYSTVRSPGSSITDHHWAPSELVEVAFFRGPCLRWCRFHKTGPQEGGRPNPLGGAGAGRSLGQASLLTQPHWGGSAEVHPYTSWKRWLFVMFASCFESQMERSGGSMNLLVAGIELGRACDGGPPSRNPWQPLTSTF